MDGIFLGLILALVINFNLIVLGVLRLMMGTSILLLATLMIVSVTWAKGVYLKPTEFIAKSFSGHPPKPRALFLKGDVKKSVYKILGHRYNKIRIRYWLKAERSAWILEEIGKERPITTGIVVYRNTIETVKVLIFRESRGWEVRHDFFTNQFVNAKLNPQRHLDCQIDGITGATLSVRAVTKLTRMALYLHSQVAGGDA